MGNNFRASRGNATFIIGGKRETALPHRLFKSTSNGNGAISVSFGIGGDDSCDTITVRRLGGNDAGNLVLHAGRNRLELSGTAKRLFHCYRRGHVSLSVGMRRLGSRHIVAM